MGRRGRVHSARSGKDGAGIFIILTPSFTKTRAAARCIRGYRELHGALQRSRARMLRRLLLAHVSEACQQTISDGAMPTIASGAAFSRPRYPFSTYTRNGIFKGAARICPEDEPARPPRNSRDRSGFFQFRSAGRRYGGGISAVGDPGRPVFRFGQRRRPFWNLLDGRRADFILAGNLAFGGSSLGRGEQTWKAARTRFCSAQREFVQAI